VPKRNTLSIIAEEAKYRSFSPSPVTYQLKPPTDWTSKSSSVNATDSTLPKGKRMTEIDMIAHRNKNPEKSTPSPQVYMPNLNVIFNREDSGLGSMGLQMKNGRTFISDDASYHSQHVPSPGQY
jgi:hypothetical protein